MKLFKRVAKILVALLLLVILSVSGTVWYLFTPENLTPIVKEQADNFLTCETQITKVEPTFFSTFPYFGIEIKNLSLSTKEDTLLYTKTFLATVNISDFLFDNKVVLNSFLLEDGYAKVEIDSNQQLNLAKIVKPSPTPPEKEEKPKSKQDGALPAIRIENFLLKNFRAQFTDHSKKSQAELIGLNLELEADFQQPEIQALAKINFTEAQYKTMDSLAMDAKVAGMNLTLQAEGKLDGDMEIETSLLIEELMHHTKQAPMEAALEKLDLQLNANGALQGEFEANTSLKLGTVHYKAQQDSLLASLHNILFSFRAEGTQAHLSEAEIRLNLPLKKLILKGQEMAKNFNFSSTIPFALKVKEKELSLKKSLIKFNQQRLNFDGKVAQSPDNKLSGKVNFNTNQWNIDNLTALLPKSYAHLLDSIDVHGLTQIKGALDWKHTPAQTPNGTVQFSLNKASAKYKAFPKVEDLNLRLTSHFGLAGGLKADLASSQIDAKILNNSLSITAAVRDMLGKNPKVDTKFKANLTLTDFAEYLPKEPKMQVQGSLQPNIEAKFELADLQEKHYHKVFAKGAIGLQNLFLNLNDSLKVELPSGKIKLDFPTHAIASKTEHLGSVEVETPNLTVNQTPNTRLITQDLLLRVALNDLLEGELAPITRLQLAWEALSVKQDTVTAFTYATGTDFRINPIKKDTHTVFDVTAKINNLGLSMAVKDTVRFDMKSFFANTHIAYDKAQTNILKKLQPSAAMKVKGISFNLNPKMRGEVTDIDYQLWPDSLNIKRAHVLFADSDFNLSGHLTNLVRFVQDGDDLVGKLNFDSDYTDLTKLMKTFSGAGKPKDTTTLPSPETPELAAKEDTKPAKPFMVPLGVDLELVTDIKKTNFNDNELKNIKGGITIRNGYVTLEQMGFTSKAANMQLTGIYKSERENHLYTFFDFHLLDIDIEELIKLIPEVDTVVPMLKSFKGKGEFHLSARVNLFSDYRPKMSTLRAGAAFAGQDLVLLDGSTFSTIADKLMFEKETENKVDSLSVELSVFRKDVDLFPFLIHMDDYQAVIEGRYTLDGTIDSHISIVETPLPVRLGLDITGPIDDLSFSVTDSKYKNLYKPEKQGLMEKQMMKMKKAMLKAHRRSVK